MFRNSLGRNPTQNEIKQSMDYLTVSDQESAKQKNILLELKEKKLNLSQDISESLTLFGTNYSKDKKSSKGSEKKVYS